MAGRDWSSEFLLRRESYEAFRAVLCDRLGVSIDSAGIALAQIESRTKTVDSFIEKVTTKGKYANPLEEMTDLVGLRVIVYYPADVRAVGTLIEREFNIDWANSSRRGEDDPPDRFGYRSDHYIVRTPAEEQFAGLSAEIQVRTVMQHAWAAVDHRIRYKADDLPRDLSRRLFRLNALLEIADEQFAGLQHASLDRSAEYEDALEHGDLGVTIDILSLRALVNREDIGPRWVRRAVTLGYDEVDPDERGDEALERLLRVVRGLNVAQVADVATVLPEDPEHGDAVLRDVLASLSVRPGQARFWAFPGDVLALIILGLVGTPELIRRSNFRREVQDALLRRLAPGSRNSGVSS